MDQYHGKPGRYRLDPDAGERLPASAPTPEPIPEPIPEEPAPDTDSGDVKPTKRRARNG